MLTHFEKALELEPKNKQYKDNLNYIKNKGKGFLGRVFKK